MSFQSSPSPVLNSRKLHTHFLICPFIPIIPFVQFFSISCLIMSCTLVPIARSLQLHFRGIALLSSSTSTSLFRLSLSSSSTSFDSLHMICVKHSSTLKSYLVIIGVGLWISKFKCLSKSCPYALSPFNEIHRQILPQQERRNQNQKEFQDKVMK